MKLKFNEKLYLFLIDPDKDFQCVKKLYHLQTVLFLTKCRQVQSCFNNKVITISFGFIIIESSSISYQNDIKKVINHNSK